MSVSVMPNAMNQGTRRLQTLGAMWGLGAALSDTAQGMIAEGYNAVQIQTAVDAGASDQQLQYLWNNFGAGTPEFGQAIDALVAGLSPSGSFLDSGSVPPSVAAIINTVYGTFNLADQAAWNQISSLLSATSAQIQTVAKLAPQDPDVMQHVSDWNGKLNQFTSWYQQIFGMAPANVPPAVTLGIAPVVIGGAIVAGVAVIVAAAYAYGQWAQTKRAQLLSQTQGALISSGASPQQISAILNPGASNLSVWLQNNMGMVLGVIVLIALAPPLIKKL